MSLHAQDRRDAIRRSAASLAGYPGQQLPELDLEQADKIASGSVYFQRRIPVQVGLRGIDWSGGHIHHQSWPEQLNRFFHLSPLAAAYVSTQDERYAAAARAYIEDWMRGDPYPTTVKRRAGDSALTMSIRLGTSGHPGWTGHLAVFLDSRAFDDAFLDRMLASVAGQAEYLVTHLAVGPNWYISQLDALVFLSLRLPFLKNADSLRRTGIERLRYELTTQFTNDGAHVERTPSYHHSMTSVAVTYFDLARRFPEADVGVDAQRVARSLDYSAHSEMCGFNDSDPAANGATERHRTARREALSRLGLAGATPPSPPLDQVFPDAGHVFSRTGWDREADYLAFDAGKWGGSHTHLSRLSFTFRIGGKMVVADPGRLSYEMSEPIGPYGKSTAAHSTVAVGGWNQSGADAQLTHAEFTTETATLRGRYQGGYWSGRYGWRWDEGHGLGVWGEHERALLWVKRKYLLVLDRVATDGGQTIWNDFQLGPAAWKAGGLRCESADGVRIEMAVAPPGVSMDWAEGQGDPPRGWIKLRDEEKTAARHLRFRYPSQPNRAVVTAVVIAGARYAVRAEGTGTNSVSIQRPDGGVERVAWDSDLIPRRS